MGQNVHINKQIEMQIEIYGETLVDKFWRVKELICQLFTMLE